MKFIFVGAGKVGEKLISNFVSEGNDISIIDTDSKTVDSIVNRFDVQGIIGNGVERETLIEAGIVDADFFIASTSRDETNILCCVYAKKLGAKHTIARVSSPDYFKETLSIKNELGVDLVFNPEFRTAVEIVQMLEFPSAKSVENFFGGKALLTEFDINEESPLVGKTLSEINSEYKCKLLFGYVKRGDDEIIPKGDFKIQPNDNIRIISEEKDLNLFLTNIHLSNHHIKSVFVIGGGKVTYYLTKKLLDMDMSVKIVEQNKEKCKELADEFPQAMVLLGDGTDSDLLTEENLKDSDACVSLTGVDEENVIVSLYAKKQNVKKVIAKVSRQSVNDMVKELGIDSIVNPKDIVANHVLRFVRAHSGKTENSVKKLYRLGSTAEALEFTVPENFSALNIKFKNLPLKKNVLVGGIVRGENFILPSGDSEFLPNDKVLIFTLGNGFTELEQVLR